MIDAVVAELNFYLVTKGEPNPWSYAQYHCGTLSNVYSSIYWSFHQRQRNDGMARKANPADVVRTEGKSEAMTVNLKAGGAKAAATRKRRATVKKTTDTK
jgi:hypothetical protein